MTQYADIYEVKIARNYHNTLFLHKEETDTMIQLKMERLKANTPSYNEKRIKELTLKIQRIKDELHKTLTQKLEVKKHLKHDDYPALLAFVIFET